MQLEILKELLTNVQDGKITVESAIAELKDLPYKDMDFVKVDTHRSLRKGFPEVIFGSGKTSEQIIKILQRMEKSHNSILVTKLEKDKAQDIQNIFPNANYNELAKILALQKKSKTGNINYKDNLKKGTIVVVTAGTSDIPIAEEALVTARVMGNKVEYSYDIGVAGIHRLLDKKELLDKASVIIVVAGMEGALASVVAGLVDCPVIGVPTSIGYGASFNGLAALLGMLNSCSCGVSVVNIDNGFGAGYLASLINT